MLAKKARSQKQEKITRLEWRLQDVNSGKIFERVYTTELKARWHEAKFNQNGMLFNSPYRTQVVHVKATYALNLVMDKIPLKIKVITTCLPNESKTISTLALPGTGYLRMNRRKPSVK